jgi:hypothetical protein
MQWVEIESWHLIESYSISEQGIPTVRTRCGLEQRSSAPFLDRLPGGKEKSCENCLKLVTRDLDHAPAAPKKARKAK